MKIYVLLALSLISLAAKADIPCDIYLKGSINGWSDNEKYKFRQTNDPDVVYLSMNRIEGEFKIASSDWTVMNYGGCGYLGEKQEVDTGTYRPVWYAPNFTCAGLSDVTFIFDFHLSYAPSLIVVPTAEFNVSDYEFPDLSGLITDITEADYGDMERSGIYLMSQMDDSRWAPNPRYEFRHEPGSEVYVLKVPFLYNNFKIASADWSTADYGKTTATDWYFNDGLGTFPLRKGGANFNVSPMIDLVMTLDLSDKAAPALTIAKDPDADKSWQDGYKLVYADEFNDNKLNTDRWQPYTGDHDEWNSFTTFTDRKENLEVKDGSLNLTVRREEYGGMPFTTGGVASVGGFVYRYGRLDIRMKQPPTNNGLLTALWLLGYHSSWPSCGEVDLLEHGHDFDIQMGTTPRMFITGCYGGSFGELNSAISWRAESSYSIQDGEYHLYSFFWDKEKLLCFLDLDKYPDQEPYWVLPISRIRPEDPTLAGNYFHHPYYLIMYIMAHPDGTSVETPADVTALNDANGQQAVMSIDFVRLYQKGDPDEILVARVPGDEKLSVISTASELTDADAEPVYYNLMGERVSGNNPGVLIRRQGSDVRKIINVCR